MAEINVLITSGRVVTHIRGRIMQKPVVASKERRRICVLTARGGNELEMWAINQPCFGPGCFHTHQTRDAVSALVNDGILKWVGTGRNMAAYSFGRTWKAMPSGPAREKVMQLV